MEVEDLRFSPTEIQSMALETMDELFYAYFLAFGFRPDTEKRENSDSNMSYVTREGMRNWLALHILADPVRLYSVISFSLNDTNIYRTFHTVGLILFWV
jgi:hypothetical protein